MSLLNSIDPCEGCTHCAACERAYCRDNEVSPGEVDGICPTCYETEAVA